MFETVVVCQSTTVRLMADFHSSLNSKSSFQCSGLFPENRSQAANDSETEANPPGETHAFFFFFLCLEVKCLVTDHFS